MDGFPVPSGMVDADKVKKELWNGLKDADVRVEAWEGNQVILVNVPRADRRVRPVYVGNNPNLLACCAFRLPGMGGESSPLVTQIGSPKARHGQNDESSRRNGDGQGRVAGSAADPNDLGSDPNDPKSDPIDPNEHKHDSAGSNDGFVERITERQLFPL